MPSSNPLRNAKPLAITEHKPCWPGYGTRTQATRHLYEAV